MKLQRSTKGTLIPFSITFNEFQILIVFLYAKKEQSNWFDFNDMKSSVLQRMLYKF